MFPWPLLRSALFELSACNSSSSSATALWSFAEFSCWVPRQLTNLGRLDSSGDCVCVSLSLSLPSFPVGMAAEVLCSTSFMNVDAEWEHCSSAFLPTNQPWLSQHSCTLLLLPPCSNSSMFFLIMGSRTTICEFEGCGCRSKSCEIFNVHTLSSLWELSNGAKNTPSPWSGRSRLWIWRVGLFLSYLVSFVSILQV